MEDKDLRMQSGYFDMSGTNKVEKCWSYRILILKMNESKMRGRKDEWDCQDIEGDNHQNHKQKADLYVLI